MYLCVHLSYKNINYMTISNKTRTSMDFNELLKNIQKKFTFLLIYNICK